VEISQLSHICAAKRGGVLAIGTLGYTVQT
jgi:hypothetical protein